MLRTFWYTLLCAALCTAAFAQTAARQPYSPQAPTNWKPVLVYHNGPILAGPITLYVVYYGSFTAKQHSILDTFLANVGASYAFSVPAEYYDADGQYVPNALGYQPTTNSYNDAYSLGHRLTGNNFEVEILHNAVAAGNLASDPNGLYILTISPDVALPDNVWCAYHAYAPGIVEGSQVAYAIAPDPPGGVLGGCSGNIAIYHDKVSPNFDLGMDSVVDSLLHELGEATTDPFITGWFTFTGNEMGDLCNFVYGPTYITPNGANANHNWGNRDYLAQELWSLSSNACSQGN